MSAPRAVLAAVLALLAVAGSVAGQDELAGAVTGRQPRAVSPAMQSTGAQDAALTRCPRAGRHLQGAGLGVGGPLQRAGGSAAGSTPGGLGSSLGGSSGGSSLGGGGLGSSGLLSSGGTDSSQLPSATFLGGGAGSSAGTNSWSVLQGSNNGNNNGNNNYGSSARPCRLTAPPGSSKFEPGVGDSLHGRTVGHSRSGMGCQSGG